MTSRADRYEAAVYRDALRAEHEAALRTATATCACDRCEGEGRVGAGYEDAHYCEACCGTGSLVAETVPDHGDADALTAPEPEPEREAWARETLRRRAALAAFGATRAA